jgi:chromosome segregation ATPase
MEDYRELTEAILGLRAEVMEKQQRSETVYQEEAATELKIANVEEAISNAKDSATEHLLEEHEATKLQLAKLKDEVEVQKRYCQSKNEQLKAKEEIIKTNQGKHEILQRKMEATMEELGETKRERDSAKQQIRDYQNQLAKTQEKLDTRERELNDVKARLENAQREVEALRVVNDKDGEHNTRIRASAERAKSTLAKERKGLWIVLITTIKLDQLTDINTQITREQKCRRAS